MENGSETDGAKSSKRAEKMCETARHSTSLEERKALAEEALYVHPDCADAYTLLAREAYSSTLVRKWPCSPTSVKAPVSKIHPRG